MEKMINYIINTFRLQVMFINFRLDIISRVLDNFYPRKKEITKDRINSSQRTNKE